MVTADRLDPLAPVVAGGVTFLVDRARPVAVLRAGDGSECMVTWPSAPLRGQVASPSIFAAPGCVWVVYPERTTSGSGASIAVRVGTDAAVATCELGVLAAIGADDDGVWTCPDPYLAMGDGPSTDVERDNGVFRGPPPWTEDTPMTSWEDFERAGHEAAEVLIRADVERSAAIGPNEIGQKDGYEWSTHPYGQPREVPAPLPEAPVPTPTGPATLRRVRTDGGTDQVLVSRVVSHVEAEDGVLRLIFHPTGPVMPAYDYPRRVAEIDVTAGLPADIDFDAVASRPAQDDDEDYEVELEPAVDEGDRVDLSGVTGTRWVLRRMGRDEIETAVEAVRAQYAGLDEPSTVWKRHSGRWQRVQSAYSDVHVHVEGRWPDTEVVVNFTHRPAPEAPLRRRTRVFDDVGAPATSPYLILDLEEDLATTDLAQLPLHEGRRQI